LGDPGREHGHDGLLRGTARRFARQLNSALSLASQVGLYNLLSCAVDLWTKLT